MRAWNFLSGLIAINAVYFTGLIAGLGCLGLKESTCAARVAEEFAKQFAKFLFHRTIYQRQQRVGGTG